MISLQMLCAGFSNYLVDIVVLLILAGFVFVCARRGFIDCFFEFVTTVVAFFVALLFTKAVVLATNGLFGLQNSMAASLEKTFLNIKGFDTELSSVGMEAVLESKNIPGFLVRLIVNTFGKDTLPYGTTIATVAGGSVARLAIMLIVFGILYAIVWAALFFIRKILNAMAQKITLVSRVNTILGGVAGFIEGILIIYAVLAVLSLIPSEGIMSYLNESIIIGFLYNNNLINIMLGWFI